MFKALDGDGGDVTPLGDSIGAETDDDDDDVVEEPLITEAVPIAYTCRRWWEYPTNVCSDDEDGPRTNELAV